MYGNLDQEKKHQLPFKGEPKGWDAPYWVRYYSFITGGRGTAIVDPDSVQIQSHKTHVWEQMNRKQKGGGKSVIEQTGKMIEILHDPTKVVEAKVIEPKEDKKVKKDK
jgi:hypothetical protein